MKQKQVLLFKDLPKAYGGSLLTKTKARQHGRPISTKHSMHFVLRSTLAVGGWSFDKHRLPIHRIVEKFAVKFGVRLHSMANVGNHLHIHLQLGNRHTYNSFIRAITAAIMMTVTGKSRWNKVKLERKFWDRRPFSRVISGLRQFLTLSDYIAINRLEGFGYTRKHARFQVEWGRGKNEAARLRFCSENSG